MKRYSGLIALILFIACATSPTGRKQFIMPGMESTANSTGPQAFAEMKSQTPTSSDPSQNAFVNCVANSITEAAKGQVDVDHWEIVVFKDNQVNAFALPGGKIGVYSGILPVTKTDAQLAAVLGHEVGHVIAKHGAERMSQGLGAQIVQVGASELLVKDSPNRGLIMGALGVGTQVGVLLPFGRTQESEADLIGLRLMAKAGFDPRQSVELWKNMSAASGGASPPQWLSTHPANETRIRDLEAHMAEAQHDYEQAKASGRQPHCAHP